MADSILQQLEQAVAILPRYDKKNAIFKTRRMNNSLHSTNVKINFKLLFRKIIRILFKYRVVRIADLYRSLEFQFKNGDFYQPNKKLYKGRAYRRIQEIEKCLVLLDVIRVVGHYDSKVYILNWYKSKVSGKYERSAILRNK